MDITDVTRDLLAEQADLDAICAALPDDAWEAATPSPRWAIRDQIGHLAYFDRAASIAIAEPDRFAQMKSELFEAAVDDLAVDELTLSSYRAMSVPDLLAAWRADREALATAATGLSNDDRVEWYGPSMGSKSFLTARLMEVWAHGQDVADTAGVARTPSDRLRHIAQLGFITRGWTYIVRGLDVPESTVRVELDAPSGAVWEFGPDDADAQVQGSAEDFCLVVTQRRHLDDTALTTVGDDARAWLLMAQAFAGGASEGPPPQGAA